MSLGLDKVNRRQIKPTKSKAAKKPSSTSAGATTLGATSTPVKSRPWAASEPTAERENPPSFSQPETEAALDSKWWNEILPLDLDRSTQNIQKLSEQLLEEGQAHLSKWKQILGRPRTISCFGIKLEVGSKVRLHLPPLTSNK